MIKIKHISYTYPHAARPVLQDVSFSLTPGECTAVLGKNGAGKSTLLKCIDRILPAAGSALTIDEENLSTMNRCTFAQHVAYVPQQAAPSALNVFDTVLLGRKPYIRGNETARDRAETQRAITEIGLGGFELRPVSELSGGEVQKVLLARALAQQPKLLLLDEPTSNLDPRNQHEALALIRRIAKERRIAVLVVIHDLPLALRYFDRFLFLKDGAVYASGGQEVMTPKNIEAVYEMRAEILEHDGIPLIVPYPSRETESRAHILSPQEYWEKAAAFHGHICGGLTIGYKASLYAMELLGMTFAEDEEIVCIAENDACGVDAVQAILGCTVGKGNLLFHLTGKQAFSFYNRMDGRSFRLLLRPLPAMSREESFAYLQSKEPAELFEVQETRIPLPERASRFSSVPCSVCGEMTGEPFCLHVDGKPVCKDCFEKL